MIKYLKKKLAQWVYEANQVPEIFASNKIVKGIGIDPDHVEGSSIYFELKPAIGGRILRVTRTVVDQRIGKVERDSDTYIITDSDNLGERVAKIINLQAYK